MADASQNNPKKELLYALVGLLAFLGIVLLIGVSAFLRPAGNHVAPEPVVDPTVVEPVVVEETTVVVADPDSTTSDTTASTDTASAADAAITSDTENTTNAETDNLAGDEAVDPVQIEAAPTADNTPQSEAQSVGEGTTEASQ